MESRRLNNSGISPSGVLFCKRGRVMAAVLSWPFDLLTAAPRSIVRSFFLMKEALPPSCFAISFKSKEREATTVKVHFVNSLGKTPNGGPPYKRGQMKTAVLLWAFGLIAAVTRAIVAAIVRKTGEKVLPCCKFATPVKSK